MKHLLLIVTFLLALAACSTPEPTTTRSKSANNTYTALTPDQSIQDFVGQRIWLEGQLATMVYQHMMKSDLDGIADHIYVDYHDGKQLVAYLQGLTLPDKKSNSYRFYGTVNKISGAGKGGGTHTEYYLDLERVE